MLSLGAISVEGSSVMPSGAKGLMSEQRTQRRGILNELATNYTKTYNPDENKKKCIDSFVRYREEEFSRGHVIPKENLNYVFEMFMPDLMGMYRTYIGTYQPDEHMISCIDIFMQYTLEHVAEGNQVPSYEILYDIFTNYFPQWQAFLSKIPLYIEVSVKKEAVEPGPKVASSVSDISKQPVKSSTKKIKMNKKKAASASSSSKEEAESFKEEKKSESEIVETRLLPGRPTPPLCSPFFWKNFPMYMILPAHFVPNTVPTADFSAGAEPKILNPSAEEFVPKDRDIMTEDMSMEPLDKKGQ